MKEGGIILSFSPQWGCQRGIGGILLRSDQMNHNRKDENYIDSKKTRRCGAWIRNSIGGILEEDPNVEGKPEVLMEDEVA